MITTITVKRPSGQVETVDVSAKFPAGLNDQMFATIQESTRNAGRGDVLSYSSVIESSPAESDWHQVELLQDRADAVEDRNYPEALKLRKQADELAAQWAIDYPEAAAERAAEHAEELAEMRSTASYKAMAEGRD